ncbi:MAG: hypothetical protein DSZ30_01795 [Aquificaceae bacterium]|nr:MAG: hypothetical protein DSZ30_01795 [Aquificaceae bacterium]
MFEKSPKGGFPFPNSYLETNLKRNKQMKIVRFSPLLSKVRNFQTPSPERVESLKFWVKLNTQHTRR